MEKENFIELSNEELRILRILHDWVMCRFLPHDRLATILVHCWDEEGTGVLVEFEGTTWLVVDEETVTDVLQGDWIEFFMEHVADPLEEW